MHYRIRGLDPEPFAPLFAMDDTEVAERGARRVQVNDQHAFPDRIELRDGEVGEWMLLVNHCHLDLPSAYRSSHAVYVRQGATRAAEHQDCVPEVMQRRMLSLRAFDGNGWMRDAVLVDGREADAEIRRLLQNPKVDFIHAHYAAPGCFAARIDRGA